MLLSNFLSSPQNLWQREYILSATAATLSHFFRLAYEPFSDDPTELPDHGIKTVTVSWRVAAAFPSFC